MTILVDMDDVLEQLVVAWVAFVNRRFGTDVKPEAVKEWDMSKAFPTLTHAQVYSAICDDALWDLVEPMPGAVETVKRLMDEGHRVYVVTATDYRSLKAKMDKVLFRYFPYLTWSNVIVTENKHLVSGDVLIDDGPHNLAGGSYRKILFDAGHNRGFDESSVGAVRAHSWDEVYRLLTEGGATV